MEMGGNARVNAIFEARLAQSGVHKPSNHADGPTRERFIRDKYERRKFFDSSAYDNLANIEASFPTLSNNSNGTRAAPTTAASSSPAVISEAARQRLDARKKGSTPATLQAPPIQKSPSKDSDDGFQKKPVRRTGSTASLRNNRRNVPKAPVSAPLASMDLLDLTSFDAMPTEPEVSSSTSRDSGSKGKSKGTPKNSNSSTGSGGRRSRASSKDDAVNWLDEFATEPATSNSNAGFNAFSSPAPAATPASSSSYSDDIMALYASQPNNSMGFPNLPNDNMAAAGGMNPAMMMNSNNNMMAMMNSMNNANGGMPMNMQMMMNNPQMMSFMQNPQLMAQMTAMMQTMNFNNANNNNNMNFNGTAMFPQPTPQPSQQQQIPANTMMNNTNTNNGTNMMFPPLSSQAQTSTTMSNKMAHTNAAANSMQGWFSSGVDGFGGPTAFNNLPLSAMMPPTSSVVSMSTNSSSGSVTPSRKKTSVDSSSKKDDPFAQFGMNVFRS
jgi:hypothetical protein